MTPWKRDVYTRRRAVCLWLAVLLSLCLTCFVGCSDQIYDPTQGSLSLIEGNQTREPQTGSSGGDESLRLEIRTEAPTGSVIQIPTTDPFENAEHIMRVDFLNVGNADAILLRMDDTVILVDTGESGDYHIISQKLKACGIGRIDHLIISHYDNDHIGTAAQILADYEVVNVYMPEYVRDSSLYRHMMSTLDVLEGKTTVHRLTEDMNLSLPYGRVWINPTALYEPGKILGSDNSHSLEENNYSLITSVRFGDIELLLTGDAERERMAEFASLEEVASWDYDLIKTPHHGGYDKALGEFIRNTAPRYCTVCAGDESVVDSSLVTAMRSVGSAAYYTYDGEIHFTTDGESMVMSRN
jgi:beta-lactamase superfamily II metal-dependent hydrolase